MHYIQVPPKWNDNPARCDRGAKFQLEGSPPASGDPFNVRHRLIDRDTRGSLYVHPAQSFIVRDWFSVADLVVLQLVVGNVSTDVSNGHVKLEMNNSQMLAVCVDKLCLRKRSS